MRGSRSAFITVPAYRANFATSEALMRRVNAYL
jgi:hypothetical protein